MNSENKGWNTVMGAKPSGKTDITGGGKKGQSADKPIKGPSMYGESCLPKMGKTMDTNGDAMDANRSMKKLSPDRPEPGKQI
jgi:hypothetical protein